jgi:hypothetical protein
MTRWLMMGVVVCVAQVALGEIVISEWMYNGAGTGSTGEFVEFTNTGPGSVDMTGWSFDDDSRVAGTVSLSAFGVVAPGQSVILTDETAATFATIWGLSGVTIIGGSTANLGRNDEINLFDAGGVLVDRLTYGDETYPGTVRTQTKSCNVPAADYGFSVVQVGWLLATDGDAYGSKTSTRGEVGSPGRIVGYAPSDFDRDNDVDLDDYVALADCLAGPAVAYGAGCMLTTNGSGYVAADYDRDDDVDLTDFSVFAVCYSGPGNAPDLSCGRAAGEPGGAQIILNGSSITVIGAGVTVNGTVATITAQGTYTITGTLTDGRILVDTADGGVVALVLNGVNITSTTNAPLAVLNAGYVTIALAELTTNTLTDPGTYVFDPGLDEPNASLFSKTSMSIGGTGTLIVHGNYNDAIASKDSLLITGGTITVTALDDGIRGKDELEIQGGTLTVTSGGDGLKADNADGPGLGGITISGGTLHITSGGDAVAAETDASISGGNFAIVSGGGSSVTPPADLSCKGIKGVTSVVISGGTFNTINSADDGVHSNGNVTISSPASLTIATHDDAIHADGTVHIISGSITITKSFEGIEGANITIDDGTIGVVSSDDAITADSTVAITAGTFTIVSGGGHTVTIPSTSSAKGIKGLVSVVIGGGTYNLDCADDGIHTNAAITISGGTFTIATNSSTSAGYGDGVHADGSLHITGGNITVTTAYEGIECKDITIDNGTIHVTTTDDGINGAGGAGTANYLHINGGYIYVNSGGDGIDVNGSIWMTGGTVIVNGPTADNNAPIDYDVSFNISGGFLVAAGSAGMAQAPSTSSTQRSVKITYSATKTAGTLAHIQTTTGGTNLLTFAPAKTYRSLVFSAPTLTSGLSCDLYRGGSCTGTVVDGLYQGGTYSGGTKTNTFTTSSSVTNVNAP